MAFFSALSYAAPPAHRQVGVSGPAGHREKRDRDTSIDLVRALCVVSVVVLHAIMVGVTIENGSPVFVNASEGSIWIIPVSWALQVMPLFFVIAGFSGRLAYRRHRARGGTDVDFIAARVQRLLRPALFAIAIVGVLLLVLSAYLPADLVAVAGFRYSQPLWFLAVFLLSQALVPVLTRAHERVPLTTISALTFAAVAVDVVRGQTGSAGVGFVNLAFIWLALQQLGFFLADGRIDALSRRTRIVAVAAAAAILVVTCVLGVFSPDLIANINPPTTALLLVGVVHTGLLSLHRERLARLSRTVFVARFTAFVTPRTMTIYLWHMPVLLGMAGLTALFALAAGFVLPDSGTMTWWMQRPIWLITALLLTAVVARSFARVESATFHAGGRSGVHVTFAVVLGTTGVVMLLLLSTSALTASLSAFMIAVALYLVRPVRVLAPYLRRGPGH